MFDLRLWIFILVVLINSSSGKPFNNIMASFRFPRHSAMNSSESISSSISKERSPKLVKSSGSTSKPPTILPIIYPIVLAPNTMQYLTSSVISAPSGLTVDANSPISNIVKLIVNDSWTLNGLSSANSVQTQLSTPANQNGNPPPPPPPATNLINPNLLANPSNMVSHNNLLNSGAMSTNSINPNLMASSPNSAQQMNLMNLQNQITHHQNQLNALNQVSQLNQLIQLSEQLNRTSGRILKPMINDRLLLNQSQLNMRNDYDYGFDYDTFLNKLGLSKELSFLDQFFKEDLIEHPSKNHIRNEPPPPNGHMQTANSFRNEFQALNETHYPVFFQTDHYQTIRPPTPQPPPPPKVYSTYLFPVYSP